jgi:hypothetical protein
MELQKSSDSSDRRGTDRRRSDTSSDLYRRIDQKIAQVQIERRQSLRRQDDRRRAVP